AGADQRQVKRRSAGVDSDAMPCPCVGCEIVLERRDLRPQDVGGALGDLGEGGEDVVLDQPVLRLEVRQRHLDALCRRRSSGGPRFTCPHHHNCVPFFRSPLVVSSVVPSVAPSQRKLWLEILQRAPTETFFWISTNAPTRDSSPMLHPYRLTKQWTLTSLPSLTSLPMRKKFAGSDRSCIALPVAVPIPIPVPISVVVPVGAVAVRPVIRLGEDDPPALRPDSARRRFERP